MILNILKRKYFKGLTGMAGAIALVVFALGTAHADPITVVSWGGSYGKAQDAALFTDASKNSGIKINRESGASMSKELGSYKYDIVYVYV